MEIWILLEAVQSTKGKLGVLEFESPGEASWNE